MRHLYLQSNNDEGLSISPEKERCYAGGGTYIGERSIAGAAVPGMGRSFNVGMTANY